MKIYLDTSVLLPALVSAHPKHEYAKTFFTNQLKKNEILCLNMHVFAELYANMTRFPLGKRIAPKTVAEVLHQISKVITTVHLDHQDYQAAVNRCAQLDLISGVIYDALHFQAAIKAKVDILYTANLSDFERLMTNEISFQLKSI